MPSMQSEESKIVFQTAAGAMLARGGPQAPRRGLWATVQRRRLGLLLLSRVSTCARAHSQLACPTCSVGTWCVSLCWRLRSRPSIARRSWRSSCRLLKWLKFDVCGSLFLQGAHKNRERMLFAFDIKRLLLVVGCIDASFLWALKL